QKLRVKIAVAERSVADSEERMEALQQQLRNQTRAVARLEKEKARAREEVEVCERTAAAREEETAKQILDLKQNVFEANAREQILKTEASEMSQQLEREREAAAARISALETQNNEAESMIKQMKRRIAEAEANHHQAVVKGSETRKRLEEELHEVQSQLDTERAEFEDHQRASAAAILAAQAEVKNLRQEQGRLETLLQSRQDVLKSYEAELADIQHVRGQVEPVAREAPKLQSQLADLTRTLESERNLHEAERSKRLLSAEKLVAKLTALAIKLGSSDWLKTSTEKALEGPAEEIDALNRLLSSLTEALSNDIKTVEEGLAGTGDIPLSGDAEFGLYQAVHKLIECERDRMVQTRSALHETESIAARLRTSVDREIQMVRQSQTTVGEMKVTLMTMTADRDELHQRVKEKVKETNELRNANSDLTKRLALPDKREPPTTVTEPESPYSIDRRIADFEARARRSEAEAREALGRLSAVEAAKEALLSRAFDLERQLQAAKDKGTGLEKSLCEAVATCAVQQRRVEELESELKTKRMDLVRAGTELDLTKRAMESELELIRDQCTHWKRTAEASGLRLAEAQDALRQVRAKNTDMEINFGKDKSDLEHVVLMLKQARAAAEVEKTRAEELLKTKSALLDRANDEMEVLQRARIQWEVERKIMEEQVARKDGAIRKLEFELESASELRDQLEVRLRGAETHATKSEASLRRAGFDLENLRAARDMLEMELTRLQGDLDARGATLTQRERDLDTVTKQYRDISARLAALQVSSTEEPDSSPALARLQSEHQAALARQAHLERELQLERDGRRESESALTRARARLEEELASMGRVRTQLEERVASLESQRRSNDVRVQDLVDSLVGERALRTNLRETRDALATAEDKIRELTTGRTNGGTATLAGVDQTYATRIRSLEGELEKGRKDLTAAQAHTAALERSIAPLQAELSAAQRQAMKLEDANADLRSSLASTNRKLSTLDDRAKQNFDAKLRRIAERLESQARERERVERLHLRNSEEMRDGYERQIGQLSQELSELRHAVENGRPVVRKLVATSAPVKTPRSASGPDTGNVESLSLQIDELSRAKKHLESKVLVLQSKVRTLKKDDAQQMANAAEELEKALRLEIRKSDQGHASEGDDKSSNVSILKVSRILS
ncbi:hypothetical protein BDK51DRAFT_47018, partial [Blyttiomyces helicus]